MTPHKGVVNGRTPPCCVWLQFVKRTKCSRACVRPCDPLAGHAPSRGSASHFNPVTHFQNTRGRSQAARQRRNRGTVAAVTLHRTRRRVTPVRWTCRVRRVPWKSGGFIFIYLMMLFPFFQEKDAKETLKRRSFPHLPVWDAEMMSAPHVSGYI